MFRLHKKWSFSIRSWPVNRSLATNLSLVRGFTSRDHENNTPRWYTAVLGSIGLIVATTTFLTTSTASDSDHLDEDCGVAYETGQRFINWSSTHECTPLRVYEPKSAQEVVRVLTLHHTKKTKIRPIGRGLSPNGIGMSSPSSTTPSSSSSSSSSSSHNLLSLAAIDYVEVDKNKQLVTVGAGATVNAILKELKKHGLTLANFSSIQEQQIGGWTQVAAHGTGVTLPTVEEMIVSMKLATPTEGLITLSNTANKDLFQYAKVGLGCLGVVTEVTLQCIPCMNLQETTSILDRYQLDVSGHIDRLQSNRHVRYMWIPYTNTIVSVSSHPVVPSTLFSRFIWGSTTPTTPTSPSIHPPTKPLADLLLSLQPTLDPLVTAKLSFSQLRDQLLDINPLDLSLVKLINMEEALFWHASVGTRVDDSTNILGFDCGGEQLVCEICFNMGPLDHARALAGMSKTAESKDISFVRRLLVLIEQNDIPAPSPIEQRWSASSTSPLSPAYSNHSNDVFCWVGLIMYLPPSQSEPQRQEIHTAFEGYCQKALEPLLEEYKATIHWAKIELPSNTSISSSSIASSPIGSTKSNNTSTTQQQQQQQQIDIMRTRLANRFGDKLLGFNAYRQALDPHGTLTNPLIEQLLLPKPSQP